MSAVGAGLHDAWSSTTLLMTTAPTSRRARPGRGSCPTRSGSLVRAAMPMNV
jgi:hypothetical protein